ncbi:MAG: hypothetical protein HQ566_00490 [Candidatus Omnitrophica bacterium]|nr:hypothetical protein [Candidatus Omnitrophota bacterium]
MLKNLDKKQKIEVIITLIGVVFLIFLIIGNVQKLRNKRISIVRAGETVASSMSAPISLEVREVEESAIKEAWGRDPFFPAKAGASGAGLEGVVLNGIMWDANNPLAIINSDVVKLGDKVRDMTVIEITEANVILEYEGKKHTLNLPIF